MSLWVIKYSLIRGLVWGSPPVWAEGSPGGYGMDSWGTLSMLGCLMLSLEDLEDIYIIEVMVNRFLLFGMGEIRVYLSRESWEAVWPAGWDMWGCKVSESWAERSKSQSDYKLWVDVGNGNQLGETFSPGNRDADKNSKARRKEM